jgi:hypothetical protein
MIHRPRTKAGLMSNLYWLSEAQMERLRPYFPKSHGVPRVDDRRVLGGIIFINRIGVTRSGSAAPQDPLQSLKKVERYGRVRADHDGVGGRSPRLDPTSARYLRNSRHRSEYNDI